MKTVKIKPEFLMTSEEINNYNSLPENLPETKLTAKQKTLVSELYYKYITRNIDNQAWGQPMYKCEQDEKWPSGPRVKDHEAKRFILTNLVEKNETKKELSLEDAVKMFYYAISLRPMYSKLINKIYDVSAIE